VWSWLVQIVLLAAAAVSIVLLRDELPDLSDVWRAATHANATWLAVVIVAEAASMSTFARLQRRLLRAGGVRMSIGRALAVTYASNALSTTLPAGPAIGVVYAFRQWRRGGAAAALATAVVVMGGVITTTAYGIIALLTLLAEPHSRRLAELGLVALAVAAGSLALLLWRPRSRAWARRVLRGPALLGQRSRRVRPLVHAVVHGLRQARGAVRLTRRDMGALAALAALNWLFDMLALVAACRALGIGLAPYMIAVAYFAAQAAGSLFPLLPGGLGAIEGSMIAALAAFGADAVPAGAAVGLYRVVSFWGIVAVGWLSWLGLWLSDETRRTRWPQLRAATRSAMPAAIPLAAPAALPVSIPVQAARPAPAAQPVKST
jgi:uncharacterized protein (TIRG00374 family)